MKNRIRQIILGIVAVCGWVLIVHALETVETTHGAFTPNEVASVDR
jgi:hypothetical protein